MKVEVKESNRQEEFPLLMRRKTGKELIVLFYSKHIGTVLASAEDSIYSTGEQGCRWISCFNSEEWEKFEGHLILSN